MNTCMILIFILPLISTHKLPHTQLIPYYGFNKTEKYKKNIIPLQMTLLPVE